MVVLLREQTKAGSDYPQSGELFSGLRRLKKKATFVWYRGEGHGLTTWRAEHRVDCWERIIDRTYAEDWISQ